jgi:carboxyl-terminal processing protease
MSSAFSPMSSAFSPMSSASPQSAAARAARRAALAFVCFAAIGCDTLLGTPKYGAELFEAVLDSLEARAIRSDSVDWTEIRTLARAEMADAHSDAAAYPAISRAIELLGDNHTWFRKPDGSFLSIPRSISCPAPTVASPTDLPSDIGYVRVGGFAGSSAQAADYMRAIRTQMAATDDLGLVGWIVDLRGNGGGNMWPMLAALHPFLSDTVGFFITGDDRRIGWRVQGGASYSGVSQAAVAPDGIYTPVGSTQRVAVLIDKRVGSSGEATAIAFRGRSETRFFGDSTCGVSTAIGSVAMPGGHLLGIAGAWMADRSGTIYGNGIAPDEIIADPAAVLTRAIEWLRETP